MSRKIRLKKGLDLNIAGEAIPGTPVNVAAKSVALTPDDFPGFTPKPEVAEGDKVVAGQALLRDKLAEDVKIVSPVDGTVKAIVRGARRKIERVVVECDSMVASAPQAITKVTNREEARKMLQTTGLWVMMRQRPYDIVPEVSVNPRDIFVTAFDSSPLAPDFAMLLQGKEADMAEGVRILALMTDGTVYVSRRDGQGLADIPGAEMVDIVGPNPSGVAGIQAANIAPVNKGETIWTLDALTLARIGAVARGAADSWMTTIAVTGTEVKTTGYITTVVGADMADLLRGNIVDDDRHHRIISGNVLTGKTESLDGYLRYPYTQITVIPEGDDVAEFLGWASVSPSKSSVSRSFPGHFFHRLLRPDARIMGGRRAMIMSGEYDKVIPMDIMPEYLIKAILARDIDRMEALGIYEVAPEDFALAEYVDTSKLPLQQIVREGLDFLRKELK